MTKPTAQAPAYQRITVGDAVVTAVADGHFTFDHTVLANVTADEFAEALDAAFLPKGPYPTPVNAFVVHTGGKTVLIDSGATTAMAATAGRTRANLAAAGVDAADVDLILITHLHPDHVGGITADGAAVFPNAELVVRAEELAFWTDPALPDAAKATAENAKAAIAPYAGNTTPLASDGSVATGIDSMFLPGHTPGHTGYRIHSGGEQLIIWGDIAHMAPVQLPDPGRYMAFDVVPEQAVATRRKILDEVATDRLLVAGMHLPFPAFSHIERAGAGYRLVRKDWQYSL